MGAVGHWAIREDRRAPGTIRRFRGIRWGMRGGGGLVAGREAKEVGVLGRLEEVEGSCEAIFGQRVMSSMRYGDDDDDEKRVECFRYVVLVYLYNAEFSFSDFHSKV